MEVKGVGRRRTQYLDELRNRERYCELKEEAEGQKSGNYRLSHEYKEEIKFPSISPWTC